MREAFSEAFILKKKDGVQLGYISHSVHGNFSVLLLWIFRREAHTVIEQWRVLFGSAAPGKSEGTDRIRKRTFANKASHRLVLHLLYQAHRGSTPVVGYFERERKSEELDSGLEEGIYIWSVAEGGARGQFRGKMYICESKPETWHDLLGVLMPLTIHSRKESYS